MTRSTNDPISASNHLDNVPTPGRRSVLLWLALLLTVGLALWVQLPRLTNPNSIQDDFRGYYWFNRFQEPDLYPADRYPAHNDSDQRLLGYEVGLLPDILNSLRAGYHLLFFLAGPLLSPILFNKLLIFPLILIAAYYSFRIGEELKGEWTGFALAMTFVVFNLASGDSISVAAGLPRSFAIPILLALIYYLMMKRYLAAGIVVAISGIIYAPVFVLSLATFIIAVLVAVRAGEIKMRFGWRTIVVSLILGITALIVLPRAFTIVSRSWINLSSNSDALDLLSNPIYQHGGRYHLFEQYLIVGRGGIFTKFGNFWQTLVLFILAFGTWLLVPRLERIFPKTLKQLLIASVACFVAAWAAIILASSLSLYYPSRYMRATLPLVLLIFTITNLEQALVSARLRLESMTPALRAATALVLATWTVVAAFVMKQQVSSFLNTIPNERVEWLLVFASTFAIGALFLFIFGAIRVGKEPWTISGPRRLATILITCLLVVVGAFFIIGSSKGHGYLSLSTSDIEYLDFVRTLPKDVKLASGSCVLDDIPMRARRQVLWNCEDISVSKEVMIIDTLKAYYAASLDDLLNFCHRYEVDYFVISRKAFEDGRLQVGYPFGAYSEFLKAEADPQTSHVLGDIPDSMRVYENEDVIVMQCELGQSGRLATQGTPIDGLSFLAFDETPAKVLQAGEVIMTVKWAVEKEMAADYNVCFSVEDKAGEVRQDECQPVSAELPTSQWTIPTIWHETYAFRVSPYLESGDYSIVASVDAGKEADSRSEIAVSEFRYTTLPRTFEAAEIDADSESGAVWGEVIALADYDVTESELNTLDVDVTWHVLQRMPESYKVFAHLRRAGTDEIVGQVDTIPRNWAYPTDWWEANEIITDTLSIPLGDLDPGQFELWLGFYSDESGERLPLAGSINPALIARDEAIMIHSLAE